MPLEATLARQPQDLSSEQQPLPLRPGVSCKTAPAGAPPVRLGNGLKGQLSDEALVKQLKTQQTAASKALEALYHRYANLVYSLSFQILKTREEAEDLTQEVFLVLWQGCAYDIKRGPFKGYLMMNTRSRAIDRLRSRSTHHRCLQKLSIRPLASAPNHPLEKAKQQQTIQQVRCALNNLSLKERTVLQSSYYDGLTQTEISRQFDIPLGTVKSRSRLGLKKLRCALQESL